MISLQGDIKYNLRLATTPLANATHVTPFKTACFISCYTLTVFPTLIFVTWPRYLLTALHIHEIPRSSRGMTTTSRWMTTLQSWNDGYLTPLHVACQTKNQEMIKLLLQYGADPSQCTDDCVFRWICKICRNTILNSVNYFTQYIFINTRTYGMCLNINDKSVDITVSFVYSYYSDQLSTNKEARTIHSPLFNLSSRISKGCPLFIIRRKIMCQLLSFCCFFCCVDHTKSAAEEIGIVVIKNI